MIPSPLLDRMEIIAIAGYITDEKMHIARDYLEKNTSLSRYMLLFYTLFRRTLRKALQKYISVKK